MYQEVTQAKVVTQASIRPGLNVESIALFDENGDPFTGGGAPTPGVHVAPVSAANATDLASAEALANANKTTLNALIASLQAAGYLAAT